ncbi:MAG: amidophosphoribosyltransferase [Proteobacteria bacterium]|nr:amidophosphoribosyltransferase [Pseudomonadota bacterium]MBU1639686.1 amidophosphoribosyltransferase [Pseudomonadota bacterium]
MAKQASSRPKEECGICGIFDHPDSAKLTYFGLYALQHRGQESAGITTSDGKNISEHKAMGLVSEVFKEQDFEHLHGHLAIGHVRYSTTGASNLVNAQPFTANHRGETYAVAHNGNLVNIRKLRDSLEEKGSIFQSTMDSEAVVHLLARECCKKDLKEAVEAVARQIQGAYSILLMTRTQLIALRDPQGFRPLCLGKLPNGGYVLASETCALDLIEADYVRDVEPGEALIINKDGIESFFPQGKQKSSFCIFEQVYFARPDSDIFGINVYNYRKRTGEILARECKIDADFVMPFPDSGNYAAIGYSQASGIPLEFGVIRNHYVGRTFIQPTQSMRDFSVRVKLNPVRSFLEGKRVIIIEDSIIRGTTGRSRVKSLRKAGAKEVHMLISCPPTCNPCYYGIDFPDSDQLIAAQKSIEEIRQYLDLDTLYYLSIEGLVEASGKPKDTFCLACFNGEYPVEPDRSFFKDTLSCGCG